MGNTHPDVFKCSHLQYVQRMKHMPVKTSDPPLVVGITGASGVIYGVRLLELLRACNIQTHLIVSRAAQMTLAYETGLKLADVERLATVVHSNDVVLKERRRLVLMLRETPLHIGHIRNMASVTEAGAIVYPPVPAFYALPKSIDDMVDHTLARVLDLFDIDVGKIHRWSGGRERLKQRERPDPS
jgi:flavin prenyltransferase